MKFINKTPNETTYTNKWISHEQKPASFKPSRKSNNI